MTNRLELFSNMSVDKTDSVERVCGGDDSFESSAAEKDFLLLKKNSNLTEKVAERSYGSLITSSGCRHLRFGIDNILKMDTDEKVHGDEELGEKTSQDFCNNLNDNLHDSSLTPTSVSERDVNPSEENDVTGDIDITGNMENEDNSSDESMTTEDNNGDRPNDYLSYFRLPSSFESLRSADVALMTSKTLMQTGSLNTPWPTSLLNDLRKERFSQIRRIGHPYQNRTPPKRKKPRTSFTRSQILELEKRFERQKYLASAERSALAKTLKMSDAQVKTWFQNRRTKWRRQTAEERELERQAASRLLQSLQPDLVHRKPFLLSHDRMCLSHLQRYQEKRALDS